jgi:hypothetical protein
MPPVGFEPSSPASKHPQTRALDRTATRVGSYVSDSMLLYCGGYKTVNFKLMNARVIGSKGPTKTFEPKKNEMSGHLTE